MPNSDFATVDRAYSGSTDDIFRLVAMVTERSVKRD